jgi:hypothetical protein
MKINYLNFHKSAVLFSLSTIPSLSLPTQMVSLSSHAWAPLKLKKNCWFGNVCSLNIFASLAASMQHFLLTHSKIQLLPY